MTPDDDLQGALDTAEPGTFFVLSEGTYDLDYALEVRKPGTIIEGRGPATVLKHDKHLATDTSVVINVEGTSQIRISDLKVQGAGDQYGGIRVSDAIDTLIERCTIDDVAKPGLGYGVPVLGASTRTVVRGCKFDNCRHAVAIGGHLHNRVRDTTVRDCLVTNSTDAGLDSHLEGVGVRFLYNRIFNSGSDGIIIQGSDFDVHGNHVEGSARHGILIQPLNRDCYGNIGDNRIEDTTRFSLLLLFGDTHPKYDGRVVGRTRVDIDDNHAAGKREAGLFVRDKRPGAPPDIKEHEIPPHLALRRFLD